MYNGRQLINGDEVEEFWALKDINFEVKRGDVVGIIGRNGAGKSTLLKILSRITEPSTGRVVLDGRVASLLEVGTGFHPELSGRENIYLNGAILGMRRAEIKRKFDEIVAFAEIDKFLDTPVKRYSSGMYVRLAFAVAAHLEPEILVVDEVLAVGDVEFQRKCLDKMKDVAGGGRTVLFVSHSMPAVRALCQSSILLARGSLQCFDRTASVIEAYLQNNDANHCTIVWDEHSAPGDDTCRLRGVSVTQEGASDVLLSSKTVCINFEVVISKLERDLNIGFYMSGPDMSTLWWSHHSDDSPEFWPKLTIGKNILTCLLPAGLLNTGRYWIAPCISNHGRRWIVNMPPTICFDAILDHGRSPYWTSLSDGRRQGQLAPIFTWKKK